MSGPFRLDRGGRIDRSQRLGFRFDGRAYHGHPGDTLASALLASGVRLFGRSFKYHRPRGVVTAGPEEPCALVELRTGARREANVPATTVELFEGLEARSQNRWPSLRVDMGAVNGLLAPFIPAGFYYKTFMWPGRWWESVYEPAIRRAAGLGRAAGEADPDRYETVHASCDLLVVGAGDDGLAAASAGAKAGRRVILVERDFDAGGALLADPAREMERQERLARLAGESEVRILTRTTAFGIYDHGVVGAVERVSDHLAEPPRGAVRQRQWVIRAGEVVEASGAVERLIAFPGNDRPGVMLAGAAEAYAVRFGVAAGRRAAFLVNNDEAYRSIYALAERGIAVALVVDMRGEGEAARIAERAGLPVRVGAEVARAIGAPLRGIEVRDVGRGRAERVACDLLCVSGGWSPLGVPGGTRGLGPMEAADLVVEAPGKAFVDLQNDVTADDLRLAEREGYGHVEHSKRYTTHGMGTDQGKIGGAAGAAVLARARGVAAAAVGRVTARPFASPVAWGALAGAEVGAHFRPKRRLPLHDWHERNGAVFVKIGLWLRPLVYSKAGDTSWGPVLEEARSVRGSVGLTDVSSLGKIDVQGADAATFLDRVYANTFSTLPVGKARYGLMLREDGMAFDDGTTSRLGETHFFVTTTTANAGAVLEHLEFHRDTAWPDLDVRLTNVSDQWAQLAVAGPKARAVLTGLVDRDLSDAAFPFMAAGEAGIAGVAGRIFRISFSGELAYEVSVPSASAEAVWEAILSAGAPHGIRPYGLDALNLMRIEKGHVAGSELNGQTTAGDLDLGRVCKKSGDFVGRVLAGRPGLTDPDRLALVGVRVVDAGEALRAGAHLVAGPSSRESLGYVTAACPRTEGEGFVGLALMRGGAKRTGERLHATDPVRGRACDVEIVSPHFVDPGNERVRSAEGGEARSPLPPSSPIEPPPPPSSPAEPPPSSPASEAREGDPGAERAAPGSPSLRPSAFAGEDRWRSSPKGAQPGMAGEGARAFGWPGRVDFLEVTLPKAIRQVLPPIPSSPFEPPPSSPASEAREGDPGAEFHDSWVPFPQAFGLRRGRQGGVPRRREPSPGWRERGRVRRPWIPFPQAFGLRRGRQGGVPRRKEPSPGWRRGAESATPGSPSLRPSAFAGEDRVAFLAERSPARDGGRGSAGVRVSTRRVDIVEVTLPEAIRQVLPPISSSPIEPPPSSPASEAREGDPGAESLTPGSPSLRPSAFAGEDRVAFPAEGSRAREGDPGAERAAPGSPSLRPSAFAGEDRVAFPAEGSRAREGDPGAERAASGSPSIRPSAFAGDDSRAHFPRVARVERDETGLAARVLPVSPTRRLLVRRRSMPGALAAAARACLPPGATLVDLSDAYRVIRVRGPQAKWVLSKGCRIDLNLVDHRQHRVDSTIIAQIPIILYHVDGSTFDLFAPSTLAQAFTEFLTTSAADVGLAPDEPCEDDTP